MSAPADSIPPSQPVLIRLLVRSWEYRHPSVFVGVRYACGGWNLALGVVLLASAHWIGPLAWLGVLPLAGAALLFWTGSRLQHSVQS